MVTVFPFFVLGIKDRKSGNSQEIVVSVNITIHWTFPQNTGKPEKILQITKRPQENRENLSVVRLSILHINRVVSELAFNGNTNRGTENRLGRACAHSY